MPITNEVPKSKSCLYKETFPFILSLGLHGGEIMSGLDVWLLNKYCSTCVNVSHSSESFVENRPWFCNVNPDFFPEEWTMLKAYKLIYKWEVGRINGCYMSAYVW